MKPNEKPKPVPEKDKDTRSLFKKITDALDKSKDPNAIGCMVVILKQDGSVNIQTVQQNQLELLYMAKLIDMHVTSGFKMERQEING